MPTEAVLYNNTFFEWLRKHTQSLADTPRIFSPVTHKKVETWSGVSWFGSKGKAVPKHDMKAYVGMEAELHSFLISTLDGRQKSTARSGPLPRGEGPLFLTL
jgi:hypothetical protein